MKYDFAIALFDSQSSQGARKGDVVLVREAGKEWGKKENEFFLILKNMPLEEHVFEKLTTENDIDFTGPKFRYKIDLSAAIKEHKLDSVSLFNLSISYQPAVSGIKIFDKHLNTMVS